MLCKICQRDFPKLARAHLLPDSLKKISGEFRRTGGHLIQAQLKRPKAHKIQTLNYDRQILCPTCDTSLAPFDEALKNFVEQWYNSDDRKIDTLAWKAQPYASINAHAGLLKVGLAVSLFRCSISHRGPSVNIGTKYEKQMSSYLRDYEHASDVPNFSVKIFGALRDQDDLCQVMIDPYRQKFGQMYVHVLLLFGCIILAKFGQDPWPPNWAVAPSLDWQADQVKIARIPFNKSPYIDHLEQAIKVHRGNSTDL